MDLGLRDAVVVVTGASKGIGLACARAFAREGARVVGLSRSAANLQAACADLDADGLAMRTIAVDLVDADAARAAIERVEAEVGPVAVLVNSAGAARRYAPEELDPAAFRQAMDAKYFTYVHAMVPTVRAMAARGAGSVVNVIGQGGRQAGVLHVAGGSANAALMLTTVGYARAYAARGIRVNAINPGLTRTSRVDEGLAVAARAGGLTLEQALAAETARIPMGRMAAPGEIADVALFLASARASYVTGAIVPMDGASVSVI